MASDCGEENSAAPAAVHQHCTKLKKSPVVDSRFVQNPVNYATQSKMKFLTKCNKKNIGFINKSILNLD